MQVNIHAMVIRARAAIFEDYCHRPRHVKALYGLRFCSTTGISIVYLTDDISFFFFCFNGTMPSKKKNAICFFLINELCSKVAVPLIQSGDHPFCGGTQIEIESF